jgi:hypothetical protein
VRFSKCRNIRSLVTLGCTTVGDSSNFFTKDKNDVISDLTVNSQNTELIYGLVFNNIEYEKIKWNLVFAKTKEIIYSL